MKVAYYISELLFSNDCVVVPDFGGFVANFAPAKIHPVNHTFYPPSKSILFNSKLLSDDGLLLHAIVVGENCTYEQAKQMVKDFVNDCRQILNEGKTIKLDRIGKIRKDRDGRYLFDPDTSVNYLEESFGLPTIISPPIVRTQMHKRLEKKFNDRRLYPAGEFRNKKKYWAAVALVPVLLLIGWLIFSPAPQFTTSQQTGVISFREPESNVLKLSDFHPVPDPIASVNDVSLSDKSSEIEKGLESGGNVMNESNERTISSVKYYVIGGAFKNRENAEKLLSNLRHEGYMAEEAGQNPAGLYMVSYFSSEDKFEATHHLNIIRREKNPAAWLLKK